MPETLFLLRRRVQRPGLTNVELSEIISHIRC